MKKKDLEKKIASAFENATPEIYDEITKAINGAASDNIIDFGQAAARKNRRSGKLLALAAAFALVIGISSGAYSYLIPKSTVEIDVNPSIEMRINSREHVVSCSANNSDAERIIGGMDLRGTDIEVAVNALIGSMLRTGYLSDAKNSVLVSVTDKALEAKLADEISALLNASIGSSAVMSQTINSAGSAADTLADEYSISQGKAALISDIIAADPSLEFSELAKLGVNDLNLLAATRHNEQSSITTKGEASSKGYIGFDAAAQRALAQCPGASVAETEFDCKNGVMVYEIELYSGSVEYEYIVDAVTGEILSSSSEGADYAPNGSAPASQQPTVSNGKTPEAEDKAEAIEEKIENEAISRAFNKATVTQDEAVNIALGSLQIRGKDVSQLAVEKEASLLKPVFGVEFVYDGMEYEFEIDARNGKIIKSEKSRAE